MVFGKFHIFHHIIMVYFNNGKVIILWIASESLLFVSGGQSLMNPVHIGSIAQTVVFGNTFVDSAYCASLLWHRGKEAECVREDNIQLIFR